MSDIKNKFNVDDHVIILGSEHLTWKITNTKKNKEHNYVYSLMLVDGNYEIESLPWVPEVLLVLIVVGADVFTLEDESQSCITEVSPVN